MNMVVILIPMLLLSVVFIKIGVINITAPKLSMGPPSDQQPEKDKEPLNLTIAISAKGFRIGAKAAILPAESGCPSDGPTICLEKKDVDVAAKFSESRQDYAKGRRSAGQKALDEGVGAFNYRELYNKLVEIKDKYPDETIVNLSADPDVPYSVLVRVMDTARYRLEKDSYSQDSAFLSAKAKSKGSKYVELFSDPVLSVAQ